MKIHTKIYFEHYGYTEADHIECEVCSTTAVDIHHIEAKGMGGKAGKDVISNLIALCRKCHEKAHKYELTKDYLLDKHNY